MSEFRKKVAVIHAIRLARSPLSLHNVLEFIGSTKPYVVQDEANETHAILIPTFDGDIRANVGDWVVRGVQGEISVCTPEVFAETYEPTEDESSQRAPQAAALFEAGWRTAANWMSRDDLLADIGSSAYIKDRDAAIERAVRQENSHE